MSAPDFTLEVEGASSLQRVGRRTTNKSGASSAEKAGSGRSGRSPDFQAEGVTLHLCDCREALPLDCDAVVTDPPYANGTAYNGLDDSEANLRALIAEVMPMMQASGERVLVTCGVPNMWLYPKPTWVLNWTDPSGEGGCPWGFPSWQPILAYGKDPFLQDGAGRRSDTIYKRFLRDRGLPHPCPKPVDFMVWLLNRATREGETICDPFTGSGTTAIACIRTGRKFVGIERDPQYFEGAVARIKRELAQGLLFPSGRRGCGAAGDENGESESRAGSPTKVSTTDLL